jgi:hypothetical protein
MPDVLIRGWTKTSVFSFFTDISRLTPLPAVAVRMVSLKAQQIFISLGEEGEIFS